MIDGDRSIYCEKADGARANIIEKYGMPWCTDPYCRGFDCPYRSLLTKGYIKSRQKKDSMINIVSVIVILAILAIIGTFWFLNQPAQFSDAKLVQRLGSENERTRLNAGIELAKRRNPAALVPLQESLTASDWLIRLQAAEALGQLGDPRAIPDLSALLDDSNTTVMAAAATALAEIGDQSAVDPLLRALHKQPPSKRWALAAAFSKFRDERAVPDLLEAVVLNDIVKSHIEDLKKAIEFQGADPIPSLVESVLNGGPGAWTLAEIEKSTGKQIKPIHDVITNRDLQTLSRIYLFFLYLDQDSSNVAENDRVTIADQEVLVEALFAYGDKDMAQAFANFRVNVHNPGKNILAEAANTWAEQHGYTLTVK